MLLSIYQTCRYRGVSFLKFLLSGERDMDAFCEHPRRKRRRPLIEVYPKGVTRPDFGPSKKQPVSPSPRLTHRARPRNDSLAGCALLTGRLPVYEDRAFGELPILADALEDACCADADILSHCRSEEPHVRGCWVVDAILGK